VLHYTHRNQQRSRVNQVQYIRTAIRELPLPLDDQDTIDILLSVGAKFAKNSPISNAILDAVLAIQGDMQDRLAGALEEEFRASGYPVLSGVAK
jgi:hypothetical protein